MSLLSLFINLLSKKYSFIQKANLLKGSVILDKLNGILLQTARSGFLGGCMYVCVVDVPMTQLLVYWKSLLTQLRTENIKKTDGPSY